MSNSPDPLLNGSLARSMPVYTSIVYGPLVRWDTNALTSIVHLIVNGRPLCRPANIILAGEDEGGAACGLCLRIARQSHRSLPRRRGE